ncbi:hypothetical protein [Streptomyces sp. NPDC048442]|uniref:hypothetical protein n=1 Tax=Streptomyces sp. NPDC048442 TaxID=3154823 RepID=UPI003428B41A
MSVGERSLIELVHELTSDSPEGREEACNVVRDWLHTFDQREAALIAYLLASAAVLENDPDILESALFAVCELTTTGFIQAEDISPLRKIRGADLKGSELGHLKYLESEYFTVEPESTGLMSGSGGG